MKSIIRFVLLCSCGVTSLFAQLPPECQLDIGTNMAGMADFGTELPFVDLMHNARTWYTQAPDDPNGGFNTEQAANFTYRPDGYPTHAPQTVAGSPYAQIPLTIWGRTQGWPAGTYTLLWEGTGKMRVFGTLSNLAETGPNRITFDLVPQDEGIVEVGILESDINDPVRGMHLIMPGHEATYETQPWNPVWLEKLLAFKTIRFMDWGQTNNWGRGEGDAVLDAHEFAWDERAQMDHYTWAFERGVPYEMMVKLMNDYDLDGWVCIPHRASPEYAQKMAEFFRDNLEADRHLYVEYSNEIWNWIFDQTQWLNYYGCELTGTSWPEGIVPYVQRNLDAFTTAYAGQLDRITRVVGTQLSFVDLSQRIANNLTPGSFDAISPTWYFGLNEDGDAELDAMGGSATAADIAARVRVHLPTSVQYLRDQKEQVADPLGVPLIFYEGGQHVTPYPFGVPSSYDNALLALQRDPLMYDLYNDWMDSLRQLQTGDEPLKVMHFGFVAPRSAQFGSWGMLETMTQDTNAVYAPKYSALLNNLPPATCSSVLSVDWADASVSGGDCRATVAWATASESGSDFFEVSRAIDGGGFVVVGRVPSRNAANGARYSFDDTGLAEGEYVYRITEVGFDGTAAVRDLQQVAVGCTAGTGVLQIFPNPTTDFLRLGGTLRGGGTAEVYALASGQRVLTRSFAYVGGRRINVRDLPVGAYLLVLRPEDGRLPVRGRFVKR